MGLLAKIFGAVSWSEMKGIHLDPMRPVWELYGSANFCSLFQALPALLPQDSVLYFEGGHPSGDLAEFLKENAVPERVHVAYGTIWPRPLVTHVPATEITMSRLANLMRSRPTHELADHFHVYNNQTVVLECYDAFFQPMWLTADFPEEQIRVFAERLGMTYKRIDNSRK